MEEMPRDAGQMEPMSSNADWFPSGFMEKLYSMSLSPHDDTLHIRESDCDLENNELTSQKASQILWATGSFSGLIPSGFYSVIPDKKIKEIFCNIPSLDEISSSGLEGPRADVILVDVEKDKKLSLLKQLIVTMVKGSNSYPVSVIKKIAGLVFEVYGRPNSEQCSGKVPLEEPVPIADARGIQLLGQIRNASCRPRAILFKVLADAVGLESKIIVGLPTGAIERMDSCRHMSVVVVLKSNELLVDLLRFPGQLVPFSATAVLRFHLAAGIESDSAENDSCDSPLEPNSPMWSISDRQSCDGNWSSEQDEFYLQSHYQQKVEALLNVSGPYKNILLQPVASTEGKPSLLNDESYIANAVWRKNRRKAMVEQRTAGSSPEHPLLRRQGRSLLSSPGDGQSFSDYKDGIAVSRSVGASTSGKHRTRRRSISSITPEIGDDIVRAVRAMNEALKQRNLSKEHGMNTIQKYIDAPRNLDACGEIYSERYATAGLSMKRLNANQKAISLPLSPIEFGDRANENRFTLASAWNRVFQSATFLSKTLLPFQEWSIDFSELTISTRVGIGFFGEVFRGLWNGTDVAVKIFLEQELTTENIEDFCNEIFILSRLRHPNVILFLGVCTRPPHLSMVTEYMDMGSLYNLIHMSGQKKKISWHRRLKMLCDICRGLMYMHRMKIVHRDLKSANCLVNKHLTVKICDFGLSRVIAEVTVRDCSSAGTPEWMAPELIRNEPFTEKCDIFSFGVIMWELCTLSRPWEGVPSVQVVHAVANEGSRLEIPEGPMGKLISDCWAEPDERPNCEEILSHLLDCDYTLS